MANEIAPVIRVTMPVWDMKLDDLRRFYDEATALGFDPMVASVSLINNSTLAVTKPFTL